MGKVAEVAEIADAGIFEIRRVYYDLIAKGETAPSVREVHNRVGGHYNTITSLVREVNRERLTAQTVISGLAESAQNAILAQMAVLVEEKAGIYRAMYAEDKRLLDDALDQLRIVEAKIETLEAELARLKGNHEVTVRELSVKLTAAAESHSMLEARSTELSGDRDRLIRESEAARGEATVARAELNRVETLQRSQEKQLAEKEAVSLGISQQLTDALVRASAAEARVVDAQQLRSDYERLLAKHEETVAALGAIREELHQTRSQLAAANARQAATRPNTAQPATARKRGRPQGSASARKSDAQIEEAAASVSGNTEEAVTDER